MKFSLSWLKEHLDTDADVNTVAETLTRIGLEVESVENPAEALRPFRIARVLTAERHPQADKLQVLTVDAGEGPLQVVCGAPNARAGLVGVFGAPGAYVPGSGITLKVAAIRGVESNGMMCSSRELELGDDHDGIIELPGDAPVGASYADWAGLDDPVIDVAITPNRQDCMGVRGIARDLAAAGLGTLKPLLPGRPGDAAAYAALADTLAALADEAAMPPCAVHVVIDDPEGCPAFWGRTITGVSNGQSPPWLQRKLKAAGQRPISALVDITNFVMLDLGRPSHVYDLARLNGNVTARRAREGETVTALNGRTYTLTAAMTVIADDAGVHDIAGIMGGEHSGCSETTHDVFLEVAYFTPERIAKTGQALALTSDARSRFERGVDPAFLDEGTLILTALIVAHCGGVPSRVARTGQPPLAPKVVHYDPARCLALGGIDVPAERQRAILDSLGFEVAADWRVTAPTWRRDIDGPADIVEEVTRIVGFDNVPAAPLPRAEGVAKPTATPAQKLERRLRRMAAARGLHEAVTWSFIAEREAAAFGGGVWTLDNPISEDMKVMRPSLLPGLLSAAARNIDRGASGVRLFEIGRRYLADAERPTLALVLAGARGARDWRAGKPHRFDAFDVKAEVLALLAAAGVPVGNLQTMGEAGAHYHPGQSATLRLGPKTVLASLGMLHPATAKVFDLDAAAVAEIHLDAIPAKRGTGFVRPAYSPPPLQAVRRDFAFTVGKNIAAEALLRAIRGVDRQTITDARLFDVFEGAGVPGGKKSLAIEVTLQPAGKSFTDDDLVALSAKIVAAARAATGAELRS
jgi:phenylalanyl-tRNA synthetase beta chain